MTLILAVSVAVAGMGAMAGQDTTDDESDGDAQVRVAHMSPDAPPVDVLIDGETAISNLSYGNVTDYASLPAGEHNVTVTAAGDPSTVVFSENVTFDADTNYTAVALGEISEHSENPFDVTVLEDDFTAPEPGNASVRLVHASPDAPPVDVTVAETNTTLFDDVSFGNATEYAEVPAGEYALEVRPATADDSGEVVATFNVTLDENTANSAFAAGYINPAEAPEAGQDNPFELILVTDFEFAGETTETVTATETATATETETATTTAKTTAAAEPTATETQTTAKPTKTTKETTAKATETTVKETETTVKKTTAKETETTAKATETTTTKATPTEKQTTAKKTTAKQTTPQETTAKETTAKVTKTTTPKPTTVKETTPAETTAKQTTPKETTAKETTVAKTTPKETTPKKTTPKETTVKKTTPKETTVKKTTVKETTVKKTTTKETTPKETTAKKTTPKEPEEPKITSPAEPEKPEITSPAEPEKPDVTSPAEPTPDETVPKDDSDERTVSNDS
ncbi:DUF4397 domain-containing protein [Haladaptatus cibarius]|uniref:DUF4397 domain-containing protein n=1 Tax=Haladaptatus cibarius TaxID=453847 RepID=UPI000AD12DB0|nr:DUF4397 domain-containing protein [Haladaptatus cibarius]